MSTKVVPKSKPKGYLRGNPVAKHCRTFNKAHVFVCQKSAHRAGYQKHKGNNHE